MAKSRFAGLSKATIFQKGSFIEREGNFHMRVEVVDLIPSRESGDQFLVECTCVKSDCESELVVDGRVVSAVKVGSKQTWMQGMLRKETSYPNILAFIGACAGYDPTTKEGVEGIEADIAPKSEAFLEEAIDTKCLAGVVLPVEVYKHTTREKAIRYFWRFRAALPESTSA